MADDTGQQWVGLAGARVGIFSERIWRIERHGRPVPVVMQHNVSVGRFDVTVGGFSVPMRAAQAPDGSTVLYFTVQGQAASIVVSAGAEGTTYDLQLGEELPPPERTPTPMRSPVMLGSAPRPAAPAQAPVMPPGVGATAATMMPAAPGSMVPTPPERASMPPRPPMPAAPPPMAAAAPPRRASPASIIVLCVLGFIAAAGLVAAFPGTLSRGLVWIRSPKITWKSFEPPGGRFSIDLPEDVKEETQTLQTPAGSVTTHSYSAEAETRGFAISYFDVPVYIPPDRVKGALEGGRDGALKQTHGTLLTWKWSEYLGSPCLEFSADLPHGTSLQRAYFIDSRMYFLMVTGVKPLNEEEADQFFSSFRITRL